MPEGDICALCGARPARHWSSTILQPVVLRVTPTCGPCNDAEMAADRVLESQRTEEPEPTSRDIEASLLALGPIDWSVLEPQLVKLDTMPDVDASDLAIVAYAVPRIAAHHGQALPAEVVGFVARYAHLASEIKLTQHE